MGKKATKKQPIALFHSPPNERTLTTHTSRSLSPLLQRAATNNLPDSGQKACRYCPHVASLENVACRSSSNCPMGGTGVLDALQVTALKYSESRGRTYSSRAFLWRRSPGGLSLNSPGPNSSRLASSGLSAGDGERAPKPATLSFPYYRRPTGGFSLFDITSASRFI